MGKRVLSYLCFSVISFLFSPYRSPELDGWIDTYLCLLFHHFKKRNKNEKVVLSKIETVRADHHILKVPSSHWKSLCFITGVQEQQLLPGH